MREHQYEVLEQSDIDSAEEFSPSLAIFAVCNFYADLQRAASRPVAAVMSISAMSRPSLPYGW